MYAVRGNTNPVIDRELELSNKIVRPAAEKAREYLEWATSEMNSLAKTEETLNLVVAHTQSWGITQAILAELRQLDYMLDEMASKHVKKGLFGHKDTSGVDQATDIARSIFMAELLRQIFIEDTNFTEVVNDKV